MSNFHRLEVVGRDSETQLEVSENLNCIYYIYELVRISYKGNFT